MENSLTIAIVAGLGGMFGWGFADFFAKKTVDTMGAIKSLVLAHLFGTLFFIVIALARLASQGTGLQLPYSFSSWVGLAFFGTLQMIVYWLVYEGFGKGQLAVLNPVFASYSGIVALISVIFFAEKTSSWLALALVLIFGGLLLLNTDIKGLRSKKLKITPGLKEVGVAALLAAGWTIGWDRFIKGHDGLSYALVMYVFMSLAAYVLSRLMKIKNGGVPKNTWKYLVGIGLGETIAYLAISWGFSSTDRVSVVALVSSAFSLPTIVLARLFLKEKITRLQTAATLIIICGVVLISVN